MTLEMVNIDGWCVVPSGVKGEGMRMRQTGIARVLWRKFDGVVPQSTVIVGGVDKYGV